MSTLEHLATNQRRWNELVSIHAASSFYDVPAFEAGRCALLPIEVEEMGSVDGLSLCHLQCHFGLDTLSWARRGARVVGVDFSRAAIAQAKELADRAGIDARFVETEVTRTQEVLDGEQFDRVFTSWGVIGWLPDLDAWAKTVRALLKPGGMFYLAEIHPTALLFDGDETNVRRTYPYFRDEEPLIETEAGTYADKEADVKNTTFVCWLFEMSRVVNALVDAGLTIERLEEHDATCCPILPGMTESEDRLWRLPQGSLNLPLSFSIRARG